MTSIIIRQRNHEHRAALDDDVMVTFQNRLNPTGANRKFNRREFESQFIFNPVKSRYFSHTQNMSSSIRRAAFLIRVCRAPLESLTLFAPSLNARRIPRWNENWKCKPYRLGVAYYYRCTFTTNIGDD